MKKIILLTLMTISIGSCYSQYDKIGLSDKVQLTYKDFLNLRLQILATQITSGSYSIIDMGRLDYPVSISFDENNKIVFEVEKMLDSTLTLETQKEIIQEGFEFVNVAISELIRTDFSNLNFDCQNNIIGFWYFDRVVDAKAKWEKGKFEWIK